MDSFHCCVRGKCVLRRSLFLFCRMQPVRTSVYRADASRCKDKIVGMIKVKDKSRCCGCEACVSSCPVQCIDLVMDKEGFLYPQVDVTRCIDCGKCEKVCPELVEAGEGKATGVYAAKNPDDEVRRASSSGGIFTLLAKYVLAENGVVFGARFDKDWNVVHDYTESKEGLGAFRGSKYVQSRTGETFKQAERFLKAGRKVLFSGTPCQIMGLKRYLRREYDNLLTVDFVCHGVPSPLVWRKYIEETLVRQDEKIQFRSHPLQGDNRRREKYSFALIYILRQCLYAGISRQSHPAALLLCLPGKVRTERKRCDAGGLLGYWEDSSRVG